MNSEKGSTAVEFTIILPLLMGIVFTVAVFGDIFIAHAKIYGIVRETARVGAEIGKQSSGVGAANAYRWWDNLYNDLNLSHTTCDFSSGGSARGMMFTARAVCEHELIFPNFLGVIQALADFSGSEASMPGLGSGNSITLVAQQSFRIQKHKSRFP